MVLKPWIASARKCYRNIDPHGGLRNDDT
jgi:hypothetical protein